MDNWIEHIVEEHSEFESPLSFWRWAAIATISAVVKDNVYVNNQMFNVYPNVYIMLHADSGMKKGPPVSMASRLAKLTGGVKVISGRSSIQGILKDLGNSTSAPGGQIIRGSVAFICSSELSSSIVEDKVATTILTDLYDRSYNVGQWRSLLKSETFDLKDPTITMLTATNDSMSQDFFTRKDITGGYFARTFIIHESIENRSNSLLVPLKKPIDYEKDAEYLKELSKLKGEFTPLGAREESDYCRNELVNKYTNESEFFSDAGLIYEEWYHKFKDDIRLAKDQTGTLNRFGTSVLKVAMILSLAEKSDLTISASAMEKAINYCEKLVGNVRKITLGRTEDEATNAKRKVLLLNELLSRENHQISQAQLMKKFWIQGTPLEWAEAIKSFIDANMVEINTIGNQAIISLTEESKEEMERFMKGKI